MELYTEKLMNDRKEVMHIIYEHINECLRVCQRDMMMHDDTISVPNVTITFGFPGSNPIGSIIFRNDEEKCWIGLEAVELYNSEIEMIRDEIKSKTSPDNAYAANIELW